MRVFWMVIVGLTLLAACSGEWKHYPPTDTLAVSLHSGVQAGDTLHISVYQEKDLSGKYIVPESGILALPLTGKIDVRGMDVDEIAHAIEKDLKKGGYLVNPEVLVSVSQTRFFSVIGEVLNAGEYEYKNGMTVLDAVAKGGGFSYRANQSDFDIVRKHEDSSEYIVKAGLSARILPGDVIRIRERFF